MARLIGWLFVLLAHGCVGSTVPAPGSHSFGYPGHGMLLAGASLGRAGAGYVAARPGGEERWGTPGLVGALERALASVAARFPGTPPLRVGDLSARGGGRLTHHASHRSGRDADLVFYALDARGVPAQGRGWLAYDRFGVARAPAEAGVAARRCRSSSSTPRATGSWCARCSPMRARSCEWIFCSNGVKSVLLRYAVEHEPDPAILLHAMTVLHQPSNGRPHDDHFHVRVLCGPEERAGGCGENGPIWPWLRDRVEKVDGTATRAYDDATLVDWLMAEEAAERSRREHRDTTARVNSAPKSAPRWVWGWAIALGCLGVLYLLRGVLAPVLIAWGWRTCSTRWSTSSRRGACRARPGIAILLIPALVAIALVLFLVLPAVVRDIAVLIGELPQAVTHSAAGCAALAGAARGALPHSSSEALAALESNIAAARAGCGGRWRRARSARCSAARCRRSAPRRPC